MNIVKNYHGRKHTERSLRLTLLILTCAAAAAVLIMEGVYLCSSCGSAADDAGVSDSGVQTGVSAGDATAEDAAEQVDENTRRAELIVSEMSIEEQVGQLLLPRADTLPQNELEQLISDIHAGGVVLFKSNFAEKDAAAVVEMTTALQNAGGGNMLLCVDEEGGTVVRISSNPLLRESRFESPQNVYAKGGFDGVAEDAREKCALLRSLGINVNFAPVSDVVTDENGFLYKRAFGRNAEETAQYVSTVVGVMKEESIGSSIKHFPGYGNASGDTHEGLVTSSVTEQSLRESDLKPFEAGIAAGADSVMVTHTIVSCIDTERPCSLSPAAVELLRGELGFDGVIVTDGLDMGAITNYCGGNDPCVAALLAGADLMCTPSDPRASYKSLLAALEDGTVTQEQVYAAAVRIVRWKLDIGMYDAA